MAMHIKPELDVVHGRPALALKATYFRIREFKWGVRTRAKMPLKSAEWKCANLHAGAVDISIRYKYNILHE